MKRNISINISGIIFYIEEDCYDKLQEYLTSINKYFAKYDDSREILEDIEVRIAEIFYSKLDKTKEVIVMSDVDELIETMGSVDDFQLAEEDPAYQVTYEERSFELPTEDDFGNTGRAVVQVKSKKPVQQEIFFEEESKKYNKEKERIYAYAKTQEKAYEGTTEELPRRLYRDTKRNVIGGVAAGLAHYLNVDPIWVRLAFVFLQTGFLFIPAAPFSAVLLYVILWAVLPYNDQLEENPQLKKLFRDPERGVLGGVASGLAAYLGVNEMIIRIAFISITVLYGSGIFLYIILWLLIPEARTLTEKMQMEGQPINLSSIRNYVIENINLKPKVELSQFHKIIIFPFHIISMIHQRIESFLRPFVSFAGEAIRIGGGLLLLFTSLSVSMALVAALFVMLGWGVEEAVHIDGLNSSIILNTFPTNFWMVINFFLTAFIPVFFIGLFGVMMLRKQIIWNAALGWTVIGFWFFNAIGTGVSVGMIARDFRVADTYTTIQDLRFGGNEEVFVLDIKEGGDYKEPRLRLDGHDKSELSLIKDIQSRGKDFRNAADNAQMIQYEVSQEGNTFFFPERSNFSGDAKFRFQEIHLTLQVPYDKPFKVTKRFSRIFNYFGEFGEDDILKYSRNTGLECTSCTHNDRHQHYYDNRNEEEEEAITLTTSGLGYADFDELDISGALTINIKQGNEYNVNLIGSTAAKDRVRIEQHGDRLEIKTKSWKRHSGSPAKVEVTMPSLEAIDLSGACTAKAVGFHEDKISLEINGASKLDISGKAQNLRAELSGASFLNASGLKTNELILEASGACDAKVWVDRKLSIEASGASRIRYGGSPKSVQVSNSGMSSISKL